MNSKVLIKPTPPPCRVYRNHKIVGGKVITDQGAWHIKPKKGFYIEGKEIKKKPSLWRQIIEFLPIIDR